MTEKSEQRRPGILVIAALAAWLPGSLAAQDNTSPQPAPTPPLSFSLQATLDDLLAGFDPATMSGAEEIAERPTSRAVGPASAAPVIVAPPSPAPVARAPAPTRKISRSWAVGVYR